VDVQGGGGGTGSLASGEIDNMAQALYGVIAALNAHLRRSHRPGSEPGREIEWAIQQLNSIHQRLTSASRSD